MVKEKGGFASSLIAVFVIVGCAQYSVVVLNAMMNGTVVLWTLDDESAGGAGLLRYMKDIFLLLFGFYWPYWVLKKGFGNNFWVYLFWIFVVVLIGVIPYFLDFSPWFFLGAGLRWVMLLHAAVGFFWIISSVSITDLDRDFLRRFFVWVLCFDVILILAQLNVVGLVYGMGLGESRLTGIFSNAGVAGFFSVGISMIILFLFRSFKESIFLLLLCLFIALASGTRFAMISVFLICCLVAWEGLSESDSGIRNYIMVFFAAFLPGFLYFLYWLYGKMILAVGRGDMISSQFDEGGRVFNFLRMIDVILEGEVGEFLIGRGLGVGTNTAYTLVKNAGGVPESYRFNWLVDNALLTSFFQFGVLGSIFFFFGCIVFLFRVRGRAGCLLVKFYLLLFIFFVTVFAGNPFEQYYLILPFMIAMGLIFNSSKSISI